MNGKSGMHLYQHSARCPTVIQMFLKCYSHYWRFVLMSNRTAQEQNANYMQPEPATVIATAAAATARNDHQIQQYLHEVPLPPRGYKFSQQQREEQVQFFKDKKDQKLPDLPLDLYNAFVIAVCK